MKNCPLSPVKPPSTTFCMYIFSNFLPFVNFFTFFNSSLFECFHFVTTDRSMLSCMVFCFTNHHSQSLFSHNSQQLFTVGIHRHSQRPSFTIIIHSDHTVTTHAITVINHSYHSQSSFESFAVLIHNNHPCSRHLQSSLSHHSQSYSHHSQSPLTVRNCTVIADTTAIIHSIIHSHYSQVGEFHDGF
jgi:hypothetical protein